MTPERRHQPRGSVRTPVALVLGGIELIRPLSQAGIPCAVVAPPKDATRFSRHAKTVFHWDWSSPMDRHNEDLLTRLIAFGRAQDEPPVIFYYWDEPLLFLSRFRDQLSEVFRFTVPDADLVENLVDKARFRELAEELSLPVPASDVFLSGATEPPPDVSRLGFPLIIKPNRRDRQWEATGDVHKAKAIRVTSNDQLQAVWPHLAVLGGAVVVQQCVEGPESSIESYHVYVDQAGEIAGEFTGRKIRTWPSEFGHSTALTITRAEDVRELGRDLVRKLRFRGVAKFDFKRAPDGRLYLFEVNPRFSLWHSPGARAGVNIPALVYADLTGRPRPEVTDSPRPVNWCHPNDFLAARQAGIPLRTWLAWIMRCEAKAFWSWEDPLPFIGTAASRIVQGNWS